MKKKSFKVLEDLEKKAKILENNSTKDLEPLEDTYKENITKDVSSLAERVRTYVKVQKDIWNKIPYLAFQADGKDGFSDFYSDIYESGYYELETHIHEFNLFIDCDNGDIVTMIDGPDKGLKATDNELVFLAANLEQIDGEKIIQEFEINANKCVSNFYDTVETKKWRTRTQKEYNIQKIYTRK